MSAVYRIDVENMPGEAFGLEWVARVYRLSDGEHMATKSAEDAEHAVGRAVEWIREQIRQAEPFSIEVDEDGNIVSGSVRV